MPIHPCPCCGFLVFDEPATGKRRCPICGWRDDLAQLQYPGLAGGANARSLYAHQQRLLRAVPAQVQIKSGYRRAPHWRPLLADECRQPSPSPESRTFVVDQADRTPPYYWESGE